MHSKRKQRLFEERALNVFRQAKVFLQTDKSLTPTLFLLYPEKTTVIELCFQDAQGKYASFADGVAQAVRTNADAIVAIMDTRYRKFPTKKAREQIQKNYRQGDLEAENAPEALQLVVSPHDGPDWGMVIPYTRSGETDDISYGRARSNISEGYVNNLIPEGWKTARRAKATKHKVPSGIRR